MNTRHTILTCAMAELERSGTEAFSLRAVGTAAGLTPMAVYRHFRDREALLIAVGEAAFAAWEQRIAKIKTPDPMLWLRAIGHAYIDFALDDPARFEACFILKTRVERLYPRDFAEGRSPAVASMMKRIAAAQDQGALEAGDPLELTMLYWTQLHGLVMLHRSGRFSLKRRAFQALADRAMDRMLRAPR